MWLLYALAMKCFTMFISKLLTLAVWCWAGSIQEVYVSLIAQNEVEQAERLTQITELQVVKLKLSLKMLQCKILCGFVTTND